MRRYHFILFACLTAAGCGGGGDVAPAASEPPKAIAPVDRVQPPPPCEPRTVKDDRQ